MSWTEDYAASSLKQKPYFHFIRIYHTMSVAGIRLLILLDLLAIVFYAVYYFILQKRTDTVAVVGEVLLGVFLVAFILAYQNLRKTEGQKQLVEELLSDK